MFKYLLRNLLEQREKNEQLTKRVDYAYTQDNGKQRTEQKLSRKFMKTLFSRNSLILQTGKELSLPRFSHK
jgi:hypothetical protein